MSFLLQWEEALQSLTKLLRERCAEYPQKVKGVYLFVCFPDIVIILGFLWAFCFLFRNSK